MAGTFTVQKILDGTRNVVIKVNFAGDADIVTKAIFDASAYVPEATSNKLMKIDYGLSGFGLNLMWEATSEVDLISLADSDNGSIDFTYMGGLVNNAGAGKNGDILVTTTGLASGDTGFVVLYIKKKD